MDGKVKFLVFADLHVDIMPDTVARMQVMLEAAARERVDFLLQLGDFMYPEADFVQRRAPQELALGRERAWFVCDRDDEKAAICSMIKDAGIPLYSVLGNHDMDFCGKETACAYLNLPNPYYHFDRGGVRFIALDTNNSKIDGQYVDYACCNYGRLHRPEQTTWLTPEQHDYLAQTVMSSPFPCVLLSHASLGDGIAGIQNREALAALLADLNREKRRVILALNGHSHIDGVCVRSGVPMMNINSASNIWIGHRYDAVRYSETISRLYPHIKGCAPYWDALFAVVEIGDGVIRVVGRQSSYVGPSPQALGVPRSASYHPITPGIQSRCLPMTVLDDCDHLPADNACNI